MKPEKKDEVKRTYIWGTGKIAQYVYHFYYDELKAYNIVGCIDNDKRKEGQIFAEGGLRIFSPDILLKDQNCHIIILADAYYEIEQQIVGKYPWIVGRIENYKLVTKQRLLARYRNTKDEEIKEILSYLNDHPIQVFNYNFAAKYSGTDADILYDEQAGLFYVLFEHKRMYFARHFDSKEKVSDYYRQIAMEQDLKSPHRYLYGEFQVEDNSVVVDAGVAEGNFALSVIDRVKKLYLFEADSEWVEALKYTFAPYRDKVVIVNKYLSNYTDASTVSVDEFIPEEQIDFMKLDIEGEEYYALDGARNMISLSEHMKCAVCTYHNEFDYHAVANLLGNLGFTVTHSKGYMWFPYDRSSIFDLPTLRRGLIRAEKDDCVRI